MQLEPTGNFAFDHLARQLDTELDNICLNASDVEQQLVRAACADDGRISQKEQMVIDQLKGKATAHLSFAEAPAASPPPIASPPHAVDNFYTFFLNYSQLPQGQDMGLKPAWALKPRESVGEKVFAGTDDRPYLPKDKSDQLAKQLGFKDAEDLQRKVGAPVDGQIGPLTIHHLNPYLEKHGLFTAK